MDKILYCTRGWNPAVEILNYGTRFPQLCNIYYTGKNPTYAQAKIKLFARQHGVLFKAAFAVLRCSGKMENKEYHHG
jgi:hypothetical protein